MSQETSTHTQHEEFPWTIAIVDHPPRRDSALYRRSRELMLKLVATLGDEWTFAPAPYEDHHGGGLWVRDETGWMCLQSILGIEWSAQFCADPMKVDQARLTARRVLAAFPTTLPGYVKLGYDDAEPILGTPIRTPEDVSRWTDSIFNASVPLPRNAHSAVLPKGAGYHHYPKPIVDIDHFRFDDFQLFVTDEEGLAAVVVPVAPRGSGDGRVRLVAANTQSRYMSLLRPRPRAEQPPAQRGTVTGPGVRAAGTEDATLLGEDDPLAQQAYARQTRR